MDTDDIDAFLQLLQASSRGRVVAANMLDSIELGLISVSVFADFLNECVLTFAAAMPGASSPTDIVEDISAGRGVSKRRYLRQCRQAPASLSGSLSHTMKTITFFSFLLNPKYKTGSALPIVLPAIPANSPTGRAEYRKRLDSITSRPDWSVPTAVLGRPLHEPGNCWVTTDSFSSDPMAPPYPGDDATQARDELGLIGYIAGEALLRLSFPSSVIASSPAHELARPTFLDMGNHRFQVSHSSARAAEFASAGWGATVHLGKVGDPAFADATGVNERVSESLSVPRLTGLKAELLGHVTSNRGVTVGKDDDEAFANALETGRHSKDIRERILSLIA